MEHPGNDVNDHVWYMRLFFVSDIERAIGFYVDKLGFTKKWHEADGKGTVCQVDRGSCEIILCQDTTRRDRSRVFLELSRAAVDQLLNEVAERSIPTKKDVVGLRGASNRRPGWQRAACLPRESSVSPIRRHPLLKYRSR